MNRRAFVASALIFVAACRPKGAVSPHFAAGADLAPLRAEFNAAKGKTRVIALVSPT